MRQPRKQEDGRGLWEICLHSCKYSSSPKAEQLVPPWPPMSAPAPPSSAAPLKPTDRQTATDRQNRPDLVGNIEKYEERGEKRKR